MTHLAERSPVEVTGLSVGYRTRGAIARAVSDLSFSICGGEAYGLVGESGCGKSTVALALVRYLPRNALVEAGEIRIAGRDILTMDDRQLLEWRRTKIASVFQHPGGALNPRMRVGDQIAEVYRLRRMTSSDAGEATRDILARVQIADPAHAALKYPHEMSGGQQQRVVIAMALATNPEVLLLDEPTTGLDATVEAEVLDLIESLRTTIQASILFISHNLTIVARMCDRVGVLYAGRLLEEGRSADVLTTPRHPYTRGLLECVPRLGMDKWLHPLRPIPGTVPQAGAQIPGCVFADRCWMVEERCRVEAPPMVPASEGHLSRCFFAADVPDRWRRHLVTIEGAPPVERARSAAAALGRVPPLLEVRGLNVEYRTGDRVLRAVHQLTLEIGPGEVFGLVGESGSGKSSFGRTVVGLVIPASGTVSLDRVPIGRGRVPPDMHRRLQLVVQNPDGALNPRRSVGQILRRFVSRLNPRSVDVTERVDHLLAAVRLERRHLRASPRSLSGGQKQRVAIACAFAGAPELVVCDEPVSALDVSVQAAILNLLAQLQDGQGASYLFISHDLGVIRYLADRIGVMYLGELVDVGPAAAVFSPPHHPYTEALLSAVSLNLGELPAERARLMGDIPSPTLPPSGCRFHTRCPRFLGDICKTKLPPWQRLEDGHAYRCHIPPEELGRLQVRTGAPEPEAVAPAAGRAGRPA